MKSDEMLLEAIKTIEQVWSEISELSAYEKACFNKVVNIALSRPQPKAEVECLSEEKLYKALNEWKLINKPWQFGIDGLTYFICTRFGTKRVSKYDILEVIFKYSPVTTPELQDKLATAIHKLIFGESG